jgi:GrpB-like predicted nucleotidyltransferase (UPF0157 family)
MGRFIEVVEADPTWKQAFDREAAALTRIFDPTLLEIHHIGSTAVPGLPAKPVIDILAVLTETDTIARFDGAMEELGYRVRGECLDAEIPGTPGRFYFSKDAGGMRTHQVHACAAGHPEIEDKLLFRDFLRHDSARASAYGALKRRLALEHSHDIVSYIRGKDALINQLLKDARAWGRTNKPNSQVC